ncbi:MAG: BON domain-containing protein [Gallionella sp.]|nr:BON domain-containing protein [Gallionella sp.]
MRIVSLLLLTLLTGALQGCFPVVATGVATGAMMIADRRSSGAYIDDEAIEVKTYDRIGKKYKDNKGVHINVTSFNRNVLLSGEVPNDSVKSDIADMVKTVDNVRNVSNELAVAGVSSLTSRSSDTLITSDVKLRFAQDKRFDANHVKVVTENGTVFLMGLVCEPEATAATELASTTGGVQRVVRLFEYIPCPPPAKH